VREVEERLREARAEIWRGVAGGGGLLDGGGGD
jgi:hypothetical protein